MKYVNMLGRSASQGLRSPKERRANTNHGIEYFKYLRYSKFYREYMIFIMTGPSGVRKNTIINELSNHIDFHFSTSYTTRPKRDNETEK